MLAEKTLLKTAYHFLLLHVGFDTLTYRKDYDRSPILVGHQIIDSDAVQGETFLPGQIFVFGSFALRANSLGQLEQIDSYAPGHQVWKLELCRGHPQRLDLQRIRDRGSSRSLSP